MSELRRDPVTGRWNIINTENPSGPKDFDVERHTLKGGTCPFCPGNESLTPPEIVADRPHPGAANTKGWQLRVVPNKFPALRIEGDLGSRGIGIFDMTNGVGAHEVIIETPDHQRNLADLSMAELERVIWAYVSRSVDLHKDARFRYTLIFKNYGQPAGASLEHPHSQLIALPVVPIRVTDELEGAERYYDHRDRCIFCDILHQEIDERERLVAENKGFVGFTPFASRFPFEVWIAPKHHRADFLSISKEEVGDLARILHEVLLRMRRTLDDPSYNFIIHTAPLKTREREDYHWHVELMPVLTRVAGFEWGSGFYINPTPPELAAEHLRAATL